MTTYRPYIAACFLGVALAVSFMALVCAIYPVS